MEIEKLVLSQYIHVHPLCKAMKFIRKSYFKNLCYFINKIDNQGKWKDKMLCIYSQKFGVCEEVEINQSIGYIDRIVTSKYKYNLLIDILFILAFADRDLGNIIGNMFILVYGEKYKEKVEEILDVFYEGKESLVLQPIKLIQEILPILRKNRDFYNRPEKRIMITANMSAGKSTLINALVGKNINKAQSRACTAKVHYIHNKAIEDGFIYELDHMLELDATHEVLMEDNFLNETTDIHVGTKFRSIDIIDKKICFIDTPGVNYSMDKMHKKISEEAINNIECDLLLYVMNAKNLCTDDDLEHLQFVKKNYKGTILFLINKVDSFGKNDETIIETIENVKEFLSQNGFIDPQVYPISAYAAYLAKQAIFGGIEDEEEEGVLKLLQQKLERPEHSYYKYYPIKIDVLHGEIDEYSMLRNSGILHLEKVIYG